MQTQSRQLIDKERCINSVSFSIFAKLLISLAFFFCLIWSKNHNEPIKKNPKRRDYARVRAKEAAQFRSLSLSQAAAAACWGQSASTWNWFKLQYNVLNTWVRRKETAVCVCLCPCVCVCVLRLTQQCKKPDGKKCEGKKSELNETYEKAAIGRWIVFPRSTLGVVKKTYNFLYLFCCVYGGEDEEPEHKDRTQSVSEGSHTCRTTKRKSDRREWKII